MPEAPLPPLPEEIRKKVTGTPEEKRNVLWALREMHGTAYGGGRFNAVPHIGGLVGDPDLGVRLEAMYLLNMMKEANSARFVKDRLMDSNDKMRALAKATLKEIAEDLAGKSVAGPEYDLYAKALKLISPKRFQRPDEREEAICDAIEKMAEAIRADPEKFRSMLAQKPKSP